MEKIEMGDRRLVVLIGKLLKNDKSLTRLA
jgi:hypothetical protein